MNIHQCTVLITGILLTACATTGTRPQTPGPHTIAATQEPEVKTPQTPPSPMPATTPETAPLPQPTAPAQETVPVPEPSQPVARPEPQSSPLHPAFANLTYWQSSDPTPALKALRKSCAKWERYQDTDSLKSSRPVFGTYADWRPACHIAKSTPLDANHARAFFEQEFRPAPVDILRGDGLLTGYFTPVIDVSHLASREYTEPILELPELEADRNKSRQDYTVTSSTVIAFGRPVDVFFMQVQGSGILKFPDGHMLRAAFAGHNDKPYTSIGRLLVSRGELDKDRSAKQDIEAWMSKAGFMKTKALINENDRYVFFKTSPITPGDGAIGSQGVPLIAMGSLAVDKRYYPFGVPIWLAGKFPQTGGDYKGKQQGHLLIAQDSGGAIKGRFRGDVYFGTGHEAGDKAGVMKHKAHWVLFLPTALAERLTGNS